MFILPGYLFKLNKISYKDQLINLCVLLGGMSYITYVELPSSSDADNVLSAHASPAVNTKDYEMIVEFNKHYALLSTKRVSTTGI